MEKEVKCAVCGEKCLVTDEIYTNNFVLPKTNEEELYYNLWHTPIQRCPKCNYASLDISSCLNSNIIFAKDIKIILNNPILAKMKDARHNLIEDYMLASVYYNLLNDNLQCAKCLLQAGDYAYDEAMFWSVYVLDDNEEIEYKEIISFAKELYHKGTEFLKQYLYSNSLDIDHQLLLIGVLNESGSKGRLESNILIESLKKQKLTENQSTILKFLQRN